MRDPALTWLTIVTVVKDDREGFRRTASSVVDQHLEGVEWLVVDSSDDRSAIPSALDNMAQVNLSYLWTSPAGVYPAMNDGLATASGTYVHFLNAGDTYADSVSVAVIRSLADRHPRWMFGQVCFVSTDGRRTTPPMFDYAKEKRAHFSRGRFPPHQGTIVRTEELRRFGGFDTSYRIAADYAVFLRLAQSSDPVITPSTLAVFYEGGVSSTHWQESLHEFHQARQQILGLTGPDRLYEQANTAFQITKMRMARLLRRVRA